MKVTLTKDEAEQVLSEHFNQSVDIKPKIEVEIEETLSADNVIKKFGKAFESSQPARCKIAYIKFYRSITGAGLAESKMAIEKLFRA